jgi:hypothetical protein
MRDESVLEYVALHYGQEILKNASREQDDYDYLEALLESGEWSKFAPSYTGQHKSTENDPML